MPTIALCIDYPNKLGGRFRKLSLGTEDKICLRLEDSGRNHEFTEPITALALLHLLSANGALETLKYLTEERDRLLDLLEKTN